MKLLPSTILASYLASTALVGSAAEMEELPAVRGLRGTAKLPKMTTARELHRGHRVFTRRHRRSDRDCGSIDLVLGSGDSDECYDEAKEEVEEVFTSVDVTRVTGSSSDEGGRQYYVKCDRNRFDREIDNLLSRIDDDLDDSCGTYNSRDLSGGDKRDVVNSDGASTCGSIDLVPVESIPTAGSSGDVPSGVDLDECFDRTAEAVFEYFPNFEAVNVDTDGTEDGPREFFVDCNKQRTDREINKVLVEIDSFINNDTCGSYSSGDVFD